jgi:hypothetical protein
MSEESRLSFAQSCTLQTIDRSERTCLRNAPMPIDRLSSEQGAQHLFYTSCEAMVLTGRPSRRIWTDFSLTGFVLLAQCIEGLETEKSRHTIQCSFKTTAPALP